MANNNTSKQSKKNKSKLSRLVSPEILARVHFTNFLKLKAKTQVKIQKLRSLTIAMLPAIANDHGFKDLQFVSISNLDKTIPAIVVVDGSIEHKVTIVKENHMPDVYFEEGEEIKITSPCLRLVAEEVSLLPISHRDIGDSKPFIHFLKQQLIQNHFVMKAETFIVIQYLSQDVVLKVISIKNFASGATNLQVPSECIWQTQMNFENDSSTTDEKEKPGVTFGDIGGYKGQIESLKEEIGKLFSEDKSSIKAVKGILISGPSGCGKSLIGKALESEYKNKLIRIDLDSKSKFQGQTEMNLKHHFAQATSRAPCLVFIDDLDLLCTSRDRGDNSGIVTTLLHLIDGLSTATDGILVIATATKPQTLDAALRRPGRISHDVCLSPPEECDREDILKKMLKKVPHDLSTADMKIIASSTPGYVGGDLHTVILEAVMHSEGRRLQNQDLDYSLSITKPAALKDTAAVDHKVSLSDICGYAAVKTKMLESLNISLNYGHVFESCGLPTPTQFLVFGPPGCGKSSLIMALAAEFHLSVIRIKRSTVLGKYFGESEQNLAKLFAQAQESSPCIIHFENFEGLAGRSKGDDGGSDVEGRIINYLKVQLDGIVRNNGVFIYAETNRPDLLDKDVIRPGRFHEYFFLNLPEVEDRLSIMEKNLLPFSLPQNLSLDYVTGETDGFTISEIIQFCNEAKQSSRRDGESPHLAEDVVKEALEAVSPGTSKKMLQKQTNFASIYCPKIVKK